MDVFVHPFWARGFRPFFLMGSLFAALVLPLWAGIFAGMEMPPMRVDPMLWHAHEMIFGFVLAIISGFLLTAVANWTGWAPVRGAHLAGLVMLWLAGRAAISCTFVPYVVAASLDLAFIPVLAVSLLVPLWKKRDLRNFVFLGLLTGLFLCNLGFHALQMREFLLGALFLVLTVVSIVGGRVVPAFTVAWLRFHGTPSAQQHNLTVADTASGGLFVMLALLALAGQAETAAFGWSALALCGVQVFRMSRHYPAKALAEPMLWILHAGFLWMALGLLMTGLSSFGLAPFPLALHALTAGSIGSFIIGMVCRVSMGHTGREIRASRPTVLAFALVQVAAVLRVFAPMVFPEYYTFWVGISSTFWTTAFLIFAVVYAPVLWHKRADGMAA